VSDIWDYLDCEKCPHYKLSRGRLTMDPDTSRPDVEICLDGDFGNSWLCKQAKEAVKTHGTEA
jgi:hypothetical protein